MMMMGREMKKQTVVSDENGEDGLACSILVVPSELTFWKVRPCWEYYITCKDMWSSVPEEVRLWLSNGNEKKELSGSTSEVVVHWFLNQDCIPTRKELRSIAEEGRLDILDMLKERDVKCEGLSLAAGEKGRVDVLEWLYESKEESIWHGGAMTASMNGHLEVLKWLKEKGLEFDRHQCKMQAACCGQLGVLEWLKGEDKEGEDDLGGWRSGVFGAAAEYGHLKVIDWLVSIGFGIRVDGFNDLWHNAVAAASGGHIDVLKRLKWDGWSSDSDLAREMINACVKGGNNLETLKFLVEEGFSAMYVRFDVIYDAVRAGHVEMLKFLHSLGCRFSSRLICQAAAGRGQLEVLELAKWNDWSSSDDRFVCQMINSCLDCVQFDVLKYLVKQEKFKLSLKCVVWSCFESVIRAGHIEMLKFLSENGVKIDVRRGCKAAARAGQLEVLKWFGFEKFRSNVGFVADVVNACIKGVQFELLEFLVSAGFFEKVKFWDSDVDRFRVRCVKLLSVEAVILKGNLEMLKFLRSNGVEFDYDAFDASRCCLAAAFKGNLHVLKWLIYDVYGIPFVKKLHLKMRLTEGAASSGSVNVLKFLDARGFLSKDAYDAGGVAACNGHLDVLKFLHSKGCKFDIGECASCAASRGHTTVKEWCLRRVEKFYF